MFVKVKSYLKFILEIFNTLPKWLKILVLASIFAGSAIRLYSLFNFGFYYDTVVTQYDWGKSGFEMGYFGFWRSYPLFFDYGAVSLIYEIFLYTISLPFGGSPSDFVISMKLVNWLVEIFLAFILFWLSLKNQFENSEVSLVLNKSELSEKTINRSFILASLSYTTPALWFVSGVWGQNDTMLAVLAFLTLSFLYRGVFKASNQKPFSWNKSYKDNIIWSGVIFGLAFLTKQQILLTLPIILLIHIYKKTWKDIGKIIIHCVPFFIVVGYIYFLYTQNLWQISALLATLLLIFTWLYLTFSLTFGDNFTDLKKNFWGFLTIILIFLLPLSFVNYERVATSTFVVVGRSDIVSNGGATFWGLVDSKSAGKDPFFQIGNFNLSISITGYLVYLTAMLILVLLYFKVDWQKFRTFRLSHWFEKKLEFMPSQVLMALSSIIYFMFFTKMHSRYLHFGIVFSLIVLALLSESKHWFSWLKLLILLHLGYFINQAAIYTLQNISPNNYDQAWVYNMMNSFQASTWKISSLVSLISLIGLFYLSKKILAHNQASQL